MRFFKELGHEIDDAWKRCDYDDQAFPEIAASGLERRRPSENVAMMDIVEWVHSTRDLFRWADFESKFGQPAVRVFNSLHFYIEALFWVDSTTAIHQHGFGGAFHVMDGSSIHSRFTFEQKHRYSTRLLLGDLALRDIELLERGAIRPIHGGCEFVHSLFHLDYPSVSIVVRTPGSYLPTPQYSYSRAGIAWDPFYANESLYLRNQTLGLLRVLKHPKFFETAVRAARDADAFEAFEIMRNVTERMDSPEEASAFLDAVAPAHPELLPRLRLLDQTTRRELNIILRRKDIAAKEHRFFLALLLNVPTRKEVLRLVQEAYPGASPVEQIVRWVDELSKTPMRDRTTGEMTNVIGLRLDEVALIVLRHLLSGATNEQVVSRFREEFDDGDVDEQKDEILSLCDQFRRSLLLGSLLST